MAERLNITKPALYNYFRGKDEILYECWAIGAERVDECIDEIAATGGTGLEKLRKLIISYAETMTTDYGKSLVRFDVRDLTEHNRKIVRLAKKKIDQAFRDYIGQGIKDGSIRPCDVKLSAFAIAGSLNWIGHWYQPGGALEAEAIAREFAIRLTEGLATKSTRKKADKPPVRKRKSQGSITMNVTHGLRRALQINPNGLAIVFGDRKKSWREVGDRVARLAAGIRALGAQAGDRVAILSLNSDRYLELYLAAGWSGTVIVPLNIRWSPLENEDAMRDCRAGILFVDKAFAAVAATLAGTIPGLKLIYADDGETPAGMESYEALIARSSADAGCDARERRSRRHLLYRRHHRTLQGRHAQPRQSDGQCAERARRRAVAEQHDLSARRADVPPRQWGGDVFGAAQRRLQCHHPGLYAGRRRRRDAARPRHRRAAGADHDPDVRRSSETRRL